MNKCKKLKSKFSLKETRPGVERGTSSAEVGRSND
jgi:hypothetical protein